MPADVRIEPVSPETLAGWIVLREVLWPDEHGLAAQASQWVTTVDPNQLNLVARYNGVVIGFAEARMRQEYVNGTSTSPVAFLEGIYVAPDHRRQGLARALAEQIAAWGRGRGCSEFASDALLDNLDSHAFHAGIGFIEQERVVCFSRPL